MALDDLTSPKVYVRALKGAGVKVGGEAIRVIPFRYASEAITASVHNLTEGGPPASLKTDDFASEREELKAIAKQLREQDDGGRPDPELIAKAKTLIKSMQTKAETKYPAGSRERSEATRHLKALYGLASMLETPAINVLLAGVEKRPDATLGDLLGFMHAFNLRFGPATTPRQRAVYERALPAAGQAARRGRPGIAARRGGGRAGPARGAGRVLRGDGVRAPRRQEGGRHRGLGDEEGRPGTTLVTRRKSSAPDCGRPE